MARVLLLAPYKTGTAFLEAYLKRAGVEYLGVSVAAASWAGPGIPLK